MKDIKIKICGIKEKSTIECCNNLSVNFFGLIFYKNSPRNIKIKEAINLINYQKMKKTLPVGVFVNYDIFELLELIKITELKYIQLHGNEDDEYISKLKIYKDLKIIKAIGVESENDIIKAKNYNLVDFFLFDYKSKKNELPGGNARSFNWSLLKGANIGKPWFISGGINKKNINDLLENLNPYGIDISSGVEDLPGIKNINKIKEIVKLINDK